MASSIRRSTPDRLASRQPARPALVRDNEHLYGRILKAIAKYDMDHLLRAMIDKGVLNTGEYVGGGREGLIKLMLTNRREQRFLDFVPWYVNHVHHTSMRDLLQANQPQALGPDDTTIHRDSTEIALSQESGDSGTSGSTSPMELELSPPTFTMTQTTVNVCHEIMCVYEGRADIISNFTSPTCRIVVTQLTTQQAIHLHLVSVTALQHSQLAVV